MPETVGISHILSSEYIIPVFLVTIFLASLLASRIKIPYTMVLVGIGIGISMTQLFGISILNIVDLKIGPKLILYFIVPPLIYEAMMKVDREQLKLTRITSLLLATAGVVLATIVGGLLLTYVAGFPTLVAFAFAALIAPTDAAIVIEIFKRVKVPRTLAALMESEASFNDATGVIIFSSIIAIVFAQGISFDQVTTINQINVDIIIEGEHFAMVFFGGIAIGLAFSMGAKYLHRLIDEPFSETALSIAVLFGSVFLANALGVSGLIAAAIAGLYFGNVTLRRKEVISERVRVYTSNVWEMIAFFANSIAFLYLGLSMDIFRIGQNLLFIGIAFAAVLAARAASTYPILALSSRFTKEKIPKKWRHVIMIGGMRGALSVALVATLPEGEFKEILKAITFGVVLASLIIQYPILSRYIKKAFPETEPEAKN